MPKEPCASQSTHVRAKVHMCVAKGPSPLRHGSPHYGIRQKEKNMFYVPDGTQLAGFFECEECSNRFLSLQIAPRIICPYCGESPNMEIGPDEEMPVAVEAAKLLEVVEGEDVEKYDALLSLAITGGDYDWL